MYVSKMVEQLKEYDRLQKLIDNIEQALDDLEPKEKVEYAIGGIVNCEISFGAASGTTIIQAVINSDVTNLIREDLKTLLHEHRDTLFEEQQWLEIE